MMFYFTSSFSSLTSHFEYSEDSIGAKIFAGEDSKKIFYERRIIYRAKTSCENFKIYCFGTERE